MRLAGHLAGWAPGSLQATLHLQRPRGREMKPTSCSNMQPAPGESWPTGMLPPPPLPRLHYPHQAQFLTVHTHA